jgi:hypothetical protein
MNVDNLLHLVIQAVVSAKNMRVVKGIVKLPVKGVTVNYFSYLFMKAITVQPSAGNEQNF